MWASGTDLTTEDKPFLSQTQSNKKNGDGYWNRATAGYFGPVSYTHLDVYKRQVVWTALISFIIRGKPFKR